MLCYVFCVYFFLGHLPVRRCFGRCRACPCQSVSTGRSAPRTAASPRARRRRRRQVRGRLRDVRVAEPLLNRRERHAGFHPPRARLAPQIVEVQVGESARAAGEPPGRLDRPRRAARSRSRRRRRVCRARGRRPRAPACRAAFPAHLEDGLQPRRDRHAARLPGLRLARRQPELRPRRRAAPACHCSDAARPRRQPVSSAASTTARRCGPHAAVAAPLRPPEAVAIAPRSFVSLTVDSRAALERRPLDVARVDRPIERRAQQPQIAVGRDCPADRFDPFVARVHARATPRASRSRSSVSAVTSATSQSPSARARRRPAAAARSA